MKLAKKKVVILAASLCSFAAMSSTLPAVAVRHGFHAVWIALPLVAIETVLLVSMVVALFALKRIQ